MEQCSSSLERRHVDEPEFNLREWATKARNISRVNTSSRRFSAPHIASFRELETKSFRSNTTISSTVSSPGYTLTDEIDPSTYSFTTALKALQARTGYGWEWLSPDGIGLSSKWNEAEKYICNPFSGEFPAECLSSKTLRRRSMSSSTTTSKFSMSAPLDYSTRHPLCRTKSNKTQQDRKENDSHSTIQEEKAESFKKESTTAPTNHNSSNSDGQSSTAPSSTNPPVEEKRLIMQYEVKGREEPTIISTINPKCVDEQNEGNEKRTTEKDEKMKEKVIVYRCYSWKASCLPWKKWMKKSKANRDKKIGKTV